MNPFNVVKNVLAANLEKKGYSLMDLESALSRLNTTEGVVDTVKLASEGSGGGSGGLGLADPTGAVGTFANNYFPVTMGTGALMGLGLSAAEKPVIDQNKKLKELKHAIAQIRRAKAELAQQHGE